MAGGSVVILSENMNSAWDFVIERCNIFKCVRMENEVAALLFSFVEIHYFDATLAINFNGL
jgi:hypothetical protein